MKKITKNENEIVQSPIQQIEKLELDISKQITEAKQKAEIKISQTQADIELQIANEQENARKGRREFVRAGIESGTQASQNEIEKAEESAKIFAERGAKFIDEAVQKIILTITTSE